jgi:hypothetical protein
MTGWLTKRAVKSGRNWKRRFFVLTNEMLAYYDSEKRKVLKGSFTLGPGCEIKQLLRSNDKSAFRPFCFEIVADNRVGHGYCSEKKCWRS